MSGRESACRAPGPAGALRQAGRGCVFPRHRARRSGAGPRRRSASRWPDGTHRTCVWRGPSRRRGRCHPSQRASRTRLAIDLQHATEPFKMRGWPHRLAVGAVEVDGGRRFRPGPGAVVARIDWRAVRSWFFHGRDRAPEGVCRRRTAWSRQRHGWQAAPAAAPATKHAPPTQPARVERSIRTPWRARIWAWR